MKRQELHRPRGARACPGANRRVIEYHQPRSQTRKSTTPAPWIRNNSNTYPRQFRRQFRDWRASASSGLPRNRCRRVGKASFCYPSLPRFLAEVARILRPGGHFLYADLRRRDGIAKWEEELGDAPMRLMSERVISEQVARGLEKNLPQAQELSRHTPAFFVRRVNAKFCRTLRNGETSYRMYCFANE